MGIHFSSNSDLKRRERLSSKSCFHLKVVQNGSENKFREPSGWPVDENILKWPFPHIFYRLEEPFKGTFWPNTGWNGVYSTTFNVSLLKTRVKCPLS